MEIRIDEALRNIADPLAQEIKKLKQSYFTEKGKPESSWNPLKDNTVRQKRYKKYSNPEAFNYATGGLRDSCQVIVDPINDGLKISVRFDEDRFCDYLTETLGRDFVTFTIDEKKQISKIICELLMKELNR